MGGITCLWSGDFRQTLPVIMRGTRADQVQACSVNEIYLRKNMRVHLLGNTEAIEFSKLLLDIGEGKIHKNDNSEIQQPPGLCKIVDNIDHLISEVYPDLMNLEIQTSEYFCERSIY